MRLTIILAEIDWTTDMSTAQQTHDGMYYIQKKICGFGKNDDYIWWRFIKYTVIVLQIHHDISYWQSNYKFQILIIHD